ncbi:hypothetical protein R3I94_022744 [Phoxinus phoxinus]|uniref:Uncharacterized protein n=1 Tax=Phoxinus phoxinus TaxID=58324 RepID=A0AAN9CAR9_9TELE
MTCSLSRGAFDHDFSVIPLFQSTAENLRRESSDHAGVLDVNHPHSGLGSAVVSDSSVLVPVTRDMRLGVRGSDGRMCCGLVSAVAMIRCVRPVSPPAVLICDSFSLSFRLRNTLNKDGGGAESLLANRCNLATDWRRGSLSQTDSRLSRLSLFDLESTGNLDRPVLW